MVQNNMFNQWKWATLISPNLTQTFSAIHAASATRLSSENGGASSIRSLGLLLNFIKYCRDENQGADFNTF